MKKRTWSYLLAGAFMISLAGSAYAEEAVNEEWETEYETDTEEADAVLNVNLGDYTQFTYSYSLYDVTEDAVEEQIQAALEASVPEITYEETGTVAEGDAIRLSSYGTIDGVEDESLTIDEAETVVGSGELLEEFESQLIGLVVGEETEISLTFPDDYWSEDMAGKTAQMYVTVSGIGQEQTAPELTDEWAAENTEYDTAEDYRASVREELEEMAHSDALYDAHAQLTTQLVENAEVTFDEDLIETLAEQRIQSMKEIAEAEDLSYEEYLGTYYGMDEESYNEQAVEEVKDEQKRSAVIAAFAQAEQVDLSQEAYLAYLEETALMYGYESGEAYLEELSMWGFDSYVRESFEEEAVGAKLMEMAEEVPAEEMSEEEWDMEDWDFEDWEYDTEDFEDWEWDTEYEEE